MQKLMRNSKYRWPETGHKRYNEFSGDITAYLRANARVLGPGMAPPPPVRIGDKGTASLSCIVAQLLTVDFCCVVL
jgi:hypothetical protein